jgi:hypothetical protein
MLNALFNLRAILITQFSGMNDGVKNFMPPARVDCRFAFHCLRADETTAWLKKFSRMLLGGMYELLNDIS